MKQNFHQDTKKDKSTLWIFIAVISLLSIISGLIIAITSQLGENFHTTIIEQIQSGHPPILTFIGLGLMLAPPGILLLIFWRRSK